MVLERTIYRVDDLAISTSRPALFDLGIIELQQVVEPFEKFRP